MFCPNCGKNCGDANFCSGCGQDMRRINFEKTEEIPETEIADVEKNIGLPEIELPESLLGVYGSDDQYIRLDKTSVTFVKQHILSEYTIQYNDIGKATIYRASPNKEGYLCVYELDRKTWPDIKMDEVAACQTAILFPVTENSRVFSAYLFLRQCGIDNAPAETKNPAQEMIEAANAARQYEGEKGYVPAQAIASAPETFEVDKLAWYPGKKKAERKAKIAELEKSGQVCCPKCLSTSISANQKGFGFARGALGAAVGLDVGLIAGGVGSKKVICTCLKCGYQWKAGKK